MAAAQKRNKNTERQDLQSHENAKRDLLKLLDDPDLDIHGVLQSLTNMVCQVRVVNHMGSTIFVSVSKTNGQGQDGPWQINAGGNETWSRLPFYRVTIKATHFFNGPEFAHIDVRLNPGTNLFTVLDNGQIVS